MNFYYMYESKKFIFAASRSCTAKHPQNHQSRKTGLFGRPFRLLFWVEGAED
jgi:hypothetical protein